MCASEGLASDKSTDKCPHVDYYNITNKEMAVKVDKYNLIKGVHKVSENQDRNDEEQNTESEDKNKAESQREEECFRYIPSKDERKTMVAEDQKLEEEKELPAPYFRSVNEFLSK